MNSQQQHPDRSTATVPGGWSEQRAGLLLALAVLAVSTSSVLATFLLGDPPDPQRGVTIALWRCGGGAAVLLAVSGRRSIRLTRRQGGLMAISGALLGVHFALFLASLAHTSVASSTTLATMSPVFVAIGGAWLLREPPSRRTVVGMVITLVAAVALGLNDLLAAAGQTAVLGDVMALVSSVAIAGSLLIGRSQRALVPAAQYSAVVFSAATAILVVIVVAIGAPLAGFVGVEWLAVAGMIIGPQLLGHFLLQTVLSSIPPTVVSTSVLAEPILASLLAWWLLDQFPPAGLLVTGPILLLGVAIAARGTSRRRVLASAAGRTGDLT